MTAFFSAEELKVLPGWPTSAKCCREKAKRLGLQSRPRRGRGGGREWLLKIEFKPHFKLHLDGTIALKKRRVAI